VLIATVLRPEQREDSQLEAVRVALEQATDTLQLPVGEAEGTVQRLFRDCCQSYFSLEPEPDPDHRVPPAGTCAVVSLSVWSG
jgi:hypothetical protein